jgi:glycosyltransferase involved in cell wall biosynthesis
MKTVLLRGPVLTQSGYGVHCRQIARWLLSKDNVDLKIQALPWGDTPWLLNPNSHDGLVRKVMERTTDPSAFNKKQFDVTFQLQLPNEWDPNLGKTNVGLTAGVETDICNPDWLQNCNQMSAVVVPSKHTASAFTNTGKLVSPLHVIPEAFCDDVLRVTEDTVEKLPKFSTSFNFLIFGQITGDNPFNDRKNIFFTLKWIFETFKDDKDVGVIIKTNLGRNTNIDKKRTRDLMRLLVKECGKKEFPKLHLLHGDMSDLEVCSLYRHKQVKCLITATRGEGYGLPILEAAASDLPVLATNWSGHTDFLNHGKFISFDHELKEVHASRVDGKIFVPGAKWAEVSEEDFKKKIKKFRQSSAMPEEWSKELGGRIRENYSQEAIQKIYDEKLGDLLC